MNFIAGATGRSEAHPFHIERAGRRLFALHRPAAGGARGRGGVVFMPPFAEEMNRARRMATLLALDAAAAGADSLVFDLGGTGDSAGDFADARWDDWRGDACAAVSWLAERTDGPITLVGLRLGAFLALAAARAAAGAVGRIVLWQPVTSGKTMFTQFLRVRVAAAMAQGADGETTQGLRARLEAGETLAVAGYGIAPELARALDGLSLADEAAPAVPVDWLELGPDDGREPAPASRRVIEAWRAAGAAVDARIVAGEPFWSIQETTVAPALLAATVALIAEGAP